MTDLLLSNKDCSNIQRKVDPEQFHRQFPNKGHYQYVYFFYVVYINDRFLLSVSSNSFIIGVLLLFEQYVFIRCPFIYGHS